MRGVLRNALPGDPTNIVVVGRPGLNRGPDIGDVAFAVAGVANPEATAGVLPPVERDTTGAPLVTSLVLSRCGSPCWLDRIRLDSSSMAAERLNAGARYGLTTTAALAACPWMLPECPPGVEIVESAGDIVLASPTEALA